MSTTPKIITCASCGDRKRHQGRGICAKCWARHDKAGTLEQFARSRVRYRDNPENHIPLEGGEWVKSPDNHLLRVWRAEESA